MVNSDNSCPVCQKLIFKLSCFKWLGQEGNGYPSATDLHPNNEQFLDENRVA